MDNHVELKKTNGEIINAELICYFQLIDSQKRYVFYTLNEIVENGLVKMYVSEVIEPNMTISQNMTDEEWKNLKSIMKSMLTGNENVNIKYLDREEI